MRLVLAVDSPVWGGAEAYLSGLLTELPERFVCTVLATEPVPERLRAAAEARGSLHELPAVAGKTDVQGLRRLSRALRSAAPDVVHVNQSGPTNNRHVLGTALLHHLPTVAVLHLWEELLSGSQLRFLRATYRRSPAVVVVSEALRARAMQDLHAPAARVHLVPNGVTAARLARGSGVPGLRVGSLGRLVPHKGYDVLVEAARLLPGPGRSDAPWPQPVDIVVGGDGPDRASLEHAARGTAVRFVGAVEDPGAFLQDLDAFVLPSRDEGLPLALLEAMSAGLACLATDVGDVRKALGGVGLLVPPGNAAALADGLRSLVLDASARRSSGQLARSRVREHYSAEATARATAAVYDGVLR